METADARAYLEGLIRAATDYAHILAGVKAGILEALGRAGHAGSSPAELAATLGYREDYLRIWCETAFTIGILDDAGAGRFRLADGFDELLVPGPPTSSVAGIFTFHEPWVRERLDLSTVLRTGEEHARSDVATAALVPFLRAQAQVRTERIFRQVSAVADGLRQGAHMLDVGCGFAAQLESLAQTFPTATFVGIEPVASALEVARDLIAAAGLTDRVTLRQQGAEDLEEVATFDLVMMNVVLHEMPPAVRPRAVAAMARALRPGGLLISTDFLYPNRREDFRKPEYALGVFDQALELNWGSRHLSQDQLHDLYTSNGFTRCEFLHTDLPFPSGVRPGIRAINYLTTLAFT